MKFLKRLGGVLVVLYVLVCLGLYFIQDQIIFAPHTLPESHRFRTGTEIEVAVDDDVFINTWVREVQNPEGIIVYFHGNRGNIRRCIRQVQSFAPSNYKVYMPDYRGYGKSDGVVSSQKQLFADAQLVYDRVVNENPGVDISIVGYSLGSGMASYLAAKNPIKRLILIAPFKSIVDMKNRYFPLIPNFLIKYPLRNSKYLREAECPVYIHHGTEDEVIPYDSSVELEKIDPKKIQLTTLDGTGHRGAIFSRSIVNAF